MEADPATRRRAPEPRPSQTAPGAAGQRGQPQAASPARLGVLGGTFDPPHLGHLIAAQDARVALGLDRILLVPAGLPPHKPDRTITAGPIRLAMLRAAVEGDAGFHVSDMELRRAGPSYTVDTLRELGEAAPGCALFFLLGADQFRAFDTWRDPGTVASLAELVVMSRAGEEEPGGPAGIAFRTLPVTRIDISSSEIRRRVAAGEPIRYLVPPGVEDIIRRERLYVLKG